MVLLYSKIWYTNTTILNAKKKEQLKIDGLKISNHMIRFSQPL